MTVRAFKEKASLPALLLSMTIFGTIGIFRRYIPLPSGLIALARGLIGTLFLLLFMLLVRHRPGRAALRRNLWKLLVSGVFLGANWILFLEAQLHTTVAAATVCYYMAPVIVMLLAPFVLRERLTLLKVCCILVAFLGVIMVSGLFDSGARLVAKGNLLALCAAFLYAAIVLINKKMEGITALDRTFAQLGVSVLVLAPYTLLTEPVFDTVYTPSSVFCLILIGVLHTGVAYALYFGAVGALHAQSAALCSYIDPALAILLSAFVLREEIGLFGAVGALLVLGAAILGEWSPCKKKT